MQNVKAIGNERFSRMLKELHFQRLERRKRTASQFNVFSCLGVTTSELGHSAMLRFFLDPMEQHGQGDIFLQRFLTHVANINWKGSLNGARVLTEKVVDDLGRVDVAIHLPDDRIILIENKVRHSERPDQIEDYLKWLAKQPAPQSGHHVLIFLTPLGKQPTSTKFPEKVLTISYADIAEWLYVGSASLPNRLKTVLEQYAENCQIVGGVRMADDSLEWRTFLKDPDNIELGMDVAEAMQAIRADIYKEFWEGVKNYLCDRLSESSSDSLWEVCDNRDIKLLGIVWKNGKRGQESFSCAFEAIYGETLYGIRRGVDHPASDNRDVALVSALKSDRLASNNWWPGWRYLHNEDQAFLPKRNKENTAALLRDNLSQTHTLAVKIGEVVWNLFVRYRGVLEDLNRSYPY